MIRNILQVLETPITIKRAPTMLYTKMVLYTQPIGMQTILVAIEQAQTTIKTVVQVIRIQARTNKELD